MIEYHDYDPQKPFSVTGETHIILDNTITLNYTPLKGSVVIGGFVEVASGDELKSGEFCINYDEANAYRNADQKVHFGGKLDGQQVSVDYKGVSTLIRSQDLNEIKAFMESGAQSLIKEETDKHNKSRTAHPELRELVDGTIRELAGIKETVNIAADEDIEEMLDKYFPKSE
ncbi:hypothetical protein [Selenomonas sp. AE3005]|uniref:hypothetical protein n=1 Tax=Selenomonas sp. AE3005 TaxID=1485543 RepID=UPI0025E10B29|nr:hypothetical protein [Selenomonas sp. AE3005]